VFDVSQTDGKELPQSARRRATRTDVASSSVVSRRSGAASSLLPLGRGSSPSSHAAGLISVLTQDGVGQFFSPCPLLIRLTLRWLVLLPGTKNQEYRGRTRSRSAG